MRGYRGWVRGPGAVAGAVAAAPVLAVLAAAVLDRGSGGAVRLSLFPVALAALDDSIWECARNSVVVAAGVTIAARVVGVALARIAVRWRFWGRAPLVTLAVAGLVVPPAFGALGVRCWFGSTAAWPSAWLAFAAWFWVALTAGSALVGLAAASTLSRVDPLWEDAARLTRCGRGRAWRKFVWPVVRPEVSNALALVFTLTLVEPGAPLVLGLRRTLGFQITEAALDPEVGRLTRAAVLTLGAVALAGFARLLIGWWGGSPTPALARMPFSAARPERATPARGAWFVALFLLATAVVWVPPAGVAAASMARGARAFGAVARDPLSRRYAVNSAVLGLAVVALDLVLARALAARAVAGRRGRQTEGRAGRWLDKVPPLAVGVGVLALAWLARLAADAFRPTGGRWPVARLLEAVSDAIDPDRTPWVGLILAVGLARLPLLTRSALARRRGLSPSLIDAAITLGATRRRARRTLSGRLLGVSPASVVLTLALAATSVTPALLLAPTAETRPVGPAVLTLIDEPGDGLTRASALATAAIALNLAALAFAARARSGLFREWSRGE